MERYKLASSSCPPKLKSHRIKGHSFTPEFDKVSYKINQSDSDIVSSKLNPNVYYSTCYKLAKNGLAKNGPRETLDEESLFYRLRPESLDEEGVAVSQQPMPPVPKRPRRSDRCPLPIKRFSTQTQSPKKTRVRSSTNRRSVGEAKGGSKEKALAKGDDGSKKKPENGKIQNTKRGRKGAKVRDDVGQDESSENRRVVGEGIERCLGRNIHDPYAVNGKTALASKKEIKPVKKHSNRSSADLDSKILPSPWTDRDEEIFFDGLGEFGKDFQRIAEFFRLCSENPKSMEEIGNYYARTASALRERFPKPQSRDV